jgi:hypothetical protein
MSALCQKRTNGSALNEGVLSQAAPPTNGSSSIGAWQWAPKTLALLMICSTTLPVEIAETDALQRRADCCVYRPLALPLVFVPELCMANGDRARPWALKQSLNRRVVRFVPIVDNRFSHALWNQRAAN